MINPNMMVFQMLNVEDVYKYQSNIDQVLYSL